MSFYRSDDMECYRLIMPRQTAWDTINLLGKYDLVHIVPNKNLQAARPFIHQIKICEEGLFHIKSLQKYLNEHHIGIPREFITQEQLEDLKNMWEIHQKTGGIQQSKIIQVQEEVSRIWDYQQKLLQRKSDIKDKLILYRENLAIIKAGQKQYGESFFQIKSKFYENPQHTSLFGFGDLQIRPIVLNNQKQLSSVKKTLTRISRGNCFTSDSPFRDLFSQIFPDEEHKSVLFIIYPAQKGNTLDSKITKIIEIYCPHWSNYTLPTSKNNFKQKMQSLQRIYIQSQKMFQLTKDEDKYFLKGLLGKVQGKNITQLQYYKYYLMKERQIFLQLNQMTTHLNFIEGQVYIRREDSQQVKQILYKIGIDTKTPIATLVQQSTQKLPTHFQLNDFKTPAQQIVNTYGVPNYQEANPSLFTLVTFPFLFGVMFGDIAHGFIAFAFGVFLIYQSENSENSIIRSLYPLRYLVTLMGFFATYCGFIYNDFLSISLNLFGTCFDINAASKQGQIIHKFSSQCVYSFGLDPVWSISTNNLNYVNSLKMKLSVILGVVHMLAGVFVKASNANYFNRKIDFIFEFIPQLIFLVSLFGYMDFLIIYKWLVPWKLYEPNAPSIITTMINLPLKVGKTDKCCGGMPMWGTYDNTSQDTIQLILLALAGISIPLMLLPKPIYQIFIHKKHKQSDFKHDSENHLNNQMPRKMENQIAAEIIERPPQSPDSLIRQPKSQHSLAVPHQKEAQVQPSEIFVHQMIETIQYVLGCISNTASYLRLWALSLAHSQLSEVFFQKTVQSGLPKGMAGIPILILAFPILAGATFGVLLCMDSMQCFLHTLRLHWVEFQSKFYKGNGFLFNPLSFQRRIKNSIGKQ